MSWWRILPSMVSHLAAAAGGTGGGGFVPASLSFSVPKFARLVSMIIFPGVHAMASGCQSSGQWRKSLMTLDAAMKALSGNGVDVA